MPNLHVVTKQRPRDATSSGPRSRQGLTLSAFQLILPPYISTSSD